MLLTVVAIAMVRRGGTLERDLTASGALLDDRPWVKALAKSITGLNQAALVLRTRPQPQRIGPFRARLRARAGAAPAGYVLRCEGAPDTNQCEFLEAVRDHPPAQNIGTYFNGAVRVECPELAVGQWLMFIVALDAAAVREVNDLASAADLEVE